MQVTDVRIILVKDKNRLKGIASIMLDSVFLVHDIRIIEGTKGLFISMPSKKTTRGTFKDVAHPINAETRKMIETAIFDVYNKTLEKQQEEEKTKKIENNDEENNEL